MYILKIIQIQNTPQTLISYSKISFHISQTSAWEDFLRTQFDMTTMSENWWRVLDLPDLLVPLAGPTPARPVRFSSGAEGPSPCCCCSTQYQGNQFLFLSSHYQTWVVHKIHTSNLPPLVRAVIGWLSPVSSTPVPGAGRSGGRQVLVIACICPPAVALWKWFACRRDDDTPDCTDAVPDTSRASVGTRDMAHYWEGPANTGQTFSPSITKHCRAPVRENPAPKAAITRSASVVGAGCSQPMDAVF